MNRVASILSLFAGMLWMLLWIFEGTSYTDLNFCVALVFLCSGYVFLQEDAKQKARIKG